MRILLHSLEFQVKSASESILSTGEEVFQRLGPWANLVVLFTEQGNGPTHCTEITSLQISHFPRCEVLQLFRGKVLNRHKPR